MAKRVIFEQRSGAYLKVREHRSAGNCSLQPGLTKNATVVLESFPAINRGYQQKARALSHYGTARACFSP
ncbi:hypothetical protein D8666_07025 [Ochrobactrum soli]|nr:hypothetical protein D8666_07025 [[Ochrobactrum] soli]RRD27746.1 hypothetical protein ECB98_01440 [Brucellaceae bacterium VT-16-1752]